MCSNNSCICTMTIAFVLPEMVVHCNNVPNFMLM